MPTTAAGADVAMPMTVSCATPIASGSSRAGGAGAVPGRAVADGSVMMLLYGLPARAARSRGLFDPFAARFYSAAPCDHNDHFGRMPIS